MLKSRHCRPDTKHRHTKTCAYNIGIWWRILPALGGSGEGHGVFAGQNILALCWARGRGHAKRSGIPGFGFKNGASDS